MNLNLIEIEVKLCENAKTATDDRTIFWFANVDKVVLM